MSQRSLTAALATAASLMVLTACSGSAESTVAEGCEPLHPDIQTINEGTLTVAAYDLPPFSRIEGSAITGVDGEILAEILEMECLELQIETVAPAAAVPAIQADRADISIGAWYRTAARAEILDLVDPIYTDQMAIISEDGTSAIPDLEGKRVGTVDGYLWVSDLRAILADGLSVYANATNLYQDLAAGRIDVAVDSFGSGVFSAEDFEVEVAEPFDGVAASLEGAQTTFPLTQGNTSLLEAINDDLATLRESGRIAEILEANGLDGSAAETGDPRLIG